MSDITYFSQLALKALENGEHLDCWFISRLPDDENGNVCVVSHSYVWQYLMRGLGCLYTKAEDEGTKQAVKGLWVVFASLLTNKTTEEAEYEFAMHLARFDDG